MAKSNRSSNKQRGRRPERGDEGGADTSTAVIVGVHAVVSILGHAPERVQQLLLSNKRDDERLRSVETAAKEAGKSIQRVVPETLDEKAPGLPHQGVIAIVEPAPVRGEGFLDELLESFEDSDKKPLLLVLDGVTDPHNLGACLRTADAAGVAAVIAPRDRAAGLNATVRKVASGAAETVPFVQVTNLARTLRDIQDRGIWLLGTSDKATGDVYSADFTGGTALVMGAEGKGLRRLTEEHCDVLISIPMAGSVSSLNVSVATGVCLFEAVRQRSSKG